MFIALGVTPTSITLRGRGATVGIVVVVDRVVVEGSDVASVDGIDGGFVEGGGIQDSFVGPTHEDSLQFAVNSEQVPACPHACIMEISIGTLSYLRGLNILRKGKPNIYNCLLCSPQNGILVNPPN